MAREREATPKRNPRNEGQMGVRLLWCEKTRRSVDRRGSFNVNGIVRVDRDSQFVAQPWRPMSRTSHPGHFQRTKSAKHVRLSRCTRDAERFGSTLGEAMMRSTPTRDTPPQAPNVTPNDENSSNPWTERQNHRRVRERSTPSMIGSATLNNEQRYFGKIDQRQKGMDKGNFAFLNNKKETLDVWKN